MTAVTNGDLASMSELYQRRNRGLFQFFVRLTGVPASAEDLTHEVFLRMLRYRHTYREESGFEPWMYRIARNAMADKAKKHRLEIASAGDNDPQDTNAPNPFESTLHGQHITLLRRAMQQLSPEKRELIVLSRFQALSYEQIAAIVGCETGAAKVRVFRAVKEIGRLFQKLNQVRAS